MPNSHKNGSQTQAAERPPWYVILGAILFIMYLFMG